jgi:small subunit ribosomal protein S4
LARYTGAACRLCRREGIKLFLKGQRCLTDKCAIDKRNFVPGEHGKSHFRRRQLIGYGQQLREKQKVKRMYGVLENQFRRYFRKAESTKGVTGEILLQLLERRLDNIAFRMGFALSRPQARQFVLHGHILVNGKRVNIPSYQVKKGDEISVLQKSRKNPLILSAVEGVSGKGLPDWLNLDRETLIGQVVELPSLDAIGVPIEVSLIVELYSK